MRVDQWKGLDAPSWLYNMWMGLTKLSAHIGWQKVRSRRSCSAQESRAEVNYIDYLQPTTHLWEQLVDVAFDLLLQFDTSNVVKPAYDSCDLDLARKWERI
jgi:hypothetical protein